MPDKSHQEYYVRQPGERTPVDSGLRMLPDIAGCPTYGMKGNISTFELSQLRARMFEAARAKARRGELRIPVPPGYIWDRDAGLDLDPDERLQAAIREIFARFRRLASARQVLLSLKEDGFHFPKPSNKRNGTGFDWRPIRYYNVLAILKNPFYAGAYVYGKHGSRTAVVDGRLRKSRGHAKALEDWEVVIQDHHPGLGLVILLYKWESRAGAEGFEEGKSPGRAREMIRGAQDSDIDRSYPMTVLQRTDLTTSQKIQCAAAAVAGQHEHGSKTALSETYEISRPTVYAVGATAESVLRSHFEAPLLGGAGVRVRVDDAQLRRAVVALRVMAPNAIRPIEDLLPLRYPGVRVSYGTIQSMLVEAEARAARFNAGVSLDGVKAGALDELFSQGEPVLAGVDLDSGYLFGLSASATRDGQAWAELLRAGQGQGLGLEVVVKDAARGIAAGVSEVFPEAEQRDDCFHVLYEMNRVRRKLERRAWAAIEREGEALARLGKIRARDKTCRRKAKWALSKARRACAEAIERFDEFEAAMDTVRGALECASPPVSCTVARRSRRALSRWRSASRRSGTRSA